MSISQTTFLLGLSVITLTTFVPTGVAAANNFVFGECSPGKDSCCDCYISLAQHLFQSDDNVFNLSSAFFPTDENTPEFVVIRYHFQNASYERVQTWYWGASASYFMYPIATFQFLSLFFGKSEVFWSGEADVTLNATECEGVQDKHLEFLTQRVRICLTCTKLFNTYKMCDVTAMYSYCTIYSDLPKHDNYYNTLH